IDKGQIEAAKALGVSKTDIAKDIILPLAFRNVLPAVVNEFITLTKETAIVSVIGLHDMMYYNNAVNSKFYSMFEPMLVVFIAYYLMNKVLSFMGKLIERKLKYD
ncbi:MAG: ABC transporter permease subunit, partial [Longicatena sp.]